jgi:hypothetical protein
MLSSPIYVCHYVGQRRGFTTHAPRGNDSLKGRSYLASMSLHSLWTLLRTLHTLQLVSRLGCIPGIEVLARHWAGELQAVEAR